MDLKNGVSGSKPVATGVKITGETGKDLKGFAQFIRG